MFKRGTDEQNVGMSDVLCNFCSAEWTHERPFVEGHQGSHLCGQCLAVAYGHVVLHDLGTTESEGPCVMCLERREEPGWRSPVEQDAVICRRCIEMAAGSLERADDVPWRRPVAPEPDSSAVTPGQHDGVE